MSTAGLLIAAGAELGKAGLQYWMLQRRLEGKTREQILEELANEYDEFEANDPYELKKFDMEGDDG